jgi:hypothetical protein
MTRLRVSFVGDGGLAAGAYVAGREGCDHGLRMGQTTVNAAAPSSAWGWPVADRAPGDGDVVTGAQVQVDMARRSCGRCAHAAGHRRAAARCAGAHRRGHDVRERVVTGEARIVSSCGWGPSLVTATVPLPWKGQAGRIGSRAV